MTKKRLIVRDGDYAWIDTVIDTVIEVEDAFDLVNKLAEENKKLKHQTELLKEEKELLKDKLDRIEDILPHFLSCAEISEFRSETFNEDMALMKCWNKGYE